MFDYHKEAAEVSHMAALRNVSSDKELSNLAAVRTATSDNNIDAAGVSPSGRSRTGLRTQPFFIGVAGGTASGKTTVCDQLLQRLHDQV